VSSRSSLSSSYSSPCPVAPSCTTSGSGRRRELASGGLGPSRDQPPAALDAAHPQLPVALFPVSNDRRTTFSEPRRHFCSCRRRAAVI
jgi:hypothetical protein